MPPAKPHLLSLELIPRTVFGENLRNQLTWSQWETCKKFAKELSAGVCSVCGGAGAKGRVDCHERWECLCETTKPSRIN